MANTPIDADHGSKSLNAKLPMKDYEWLKNTAIRMKCSKASLVRFAVARLRSLEPQEGEPRWPEQWPAGDLE